MEEKMVLRGLTWVLFDKIWTIHRIAGLWIGVLLFLIQQIMSSPDRGQE